MNQYFTPMKSQIDDARPINATVSYAFALVSYS